jgi:hypothetical protein
VLTALLFAINVGVILLFIVQVYKGFTGDGKKPSLLTKAMNVAMKAAMTKCKDQASNAITLLGYEKEEADELRDQCLKMFDQLADACDALEDCQEILNDLSEVLTSKTSAAEIIDKFIKVSVKVLGKDPTVACFEPVTDSLIAVVVAAMDAAGVGAEITEKLTSSSKSLAASIVTFGVEDFFGKWHASVTSKLGTFKNVEKNMDSFQAIQ